MAKKGTRYSSEVRERSVRLVRESRADHPSEWAAIRAIASKVGCSAETLRGWVKRSGDDGRSNANDVDTKRLLELERENRELKRANEILRKASACFAQAELDRRPR
jgi:transposase